MPRKQSRAPGLYVHVPFCRRKCHYCAFYSVPSLQWQARWLEAVTREVRGQAAGWQEFDTCYLGGGTPSVLEDDTLRSLVSTLQQELRFSRQTEVTLEVNPADVTVERARRWRRLGFNRVSVGVQSFRARELRWLGRRHDPGRAMAALSELRAAGFDNLGIDLIQGLPAQTLAERLESVRRAADFGPEHLSCYELTVEPHTPLGAELAAGRCRLPGSDEAADGWLATRDLLQSYGYLQYEVSNFARRAAYQSRHNVKYWRQLPTLGLGPAAHSFDGRRRWANLGSVEGYCEALESGASSVAYREELTDEQLRFERITLGLRTSHGIGPAELEAGDPGLAGRASQLLSRGLLRRRGDRLAPSRQGLLVADALARWVLLGRAAPPSGIAAPGRA